MSARGAGPRGRRLFLLFYQLRAARPQYCRPPSHARCRLGDNFHHGARLLHVYATFSFFHLESVPTLPQAGPATPARAVLARSLPAPTRRAAMAKLTCRRKLQAELRAFMTSPPPFLPLVAVDEGDICVWHYLLQGPPDTPYEGGWYIGKLRFPVRAAAAASANPPPLRAALRARPPPDAWRAPAGACRMTTRSRRRQS